VRVNGGSGVGGGAPWGNASGGGAIVRGRGGVWSDGSAVFGSDHARWGRIEKMWTWTGARVTLLVRGIEVTDFSGDPKCFPSCMMENLVGFGFFS
jgi:hypothetical protein